MKKILVTGGTGYIGSHTAVELHSAGYEVVIIDDLSNSSESVLDQIQEIIGCRPQFSKFNLQSLSALQDFASQHSDIAGVIHFAAYKSVNESVEKPIAYYKNNLVSLLNILEVFGDKMSIVFSSSCTVYGQPDQLPVTESAQIKKAESPYGNTKQIAEEILSDACRVMKDLKVIALRYFNPVGAHPSAKIGELPNGIPQNLLPFITQSAIGKRGPVTVFGGDYPTPDGSAIRDYIHVCDVATAHIAALQKMLNEKMDHNFEVFNIGTGKGSSVLEIINVFEKTTGVKLAYEIGARRAGDIAKIFGDTSLSNRKLNWKASRTLEDMVTSAWKWEQYLKASANL